VERSLASAAIATKARFEVPNGESWRAFLGTIAGVAMLEDAG